MYVGFCGSVSCLASGLEGGQLLLRRDWQRPQSTSKRFCYLLQFLGFGSQFVIYMQSSE
jgi:hypothetical protein